MVELKKIGVMSAAKMFAVLSLIGGIVFAVFAFAVLSVIPITPLIQTASVSSPVQAGVLAFFVGMKVLLLVVIPVLMLILGFVVGTFEAWLYNIVAGKVGGAKLELSGGVVKSFDLVSTARIAALIAGTITFITFIIIALFDAFVSGGVGPLFILGLGILETVAVLIFGFALYMIFVIVYNYLARKIGGVRISLKGNVLERIEPVPVAKIYGVFAAIIGLFYGIIFAVIFSLVPGNKRAHEAV